MPMSLDDFIKKYGKESGEKRYYGLQKCLESRANTYSNHPYPRLTKEWFIWRYPSDGLERFEAHVSKSKQSIENFIDRYGLDEGTRRYNETKSKKNTVAIVKATLGEDVVKQRYEKANESRKQYFESMSDDEYQTWKHCKNEKTKKTKHAIYGNKSKLEIFIDKYGDLGPEKYAEYLQKIFKSIGASTEAETLIKSIISNNEWLQQYTLYYRDSACPEKAEWFIADKSGVHFYDLCVKESKVILEYDGTRWHPTAEQVENFGDSLMDVTGISYREKYEKDISKKSKAERHGFTVFTIRSDFTIEEKNAIILRFLEKVKENGKIHQHKNL